MMHCHLSGNTVYQLQHLIQTQPLFAMEVRMQAVVSNFLGFALASTYIHLPSVWFFFLGGGERAGGSGVNF